MKDTSQGGDKTPSVLGCDLIGHHFEGNVCSVCGATYSDSIVFALSEDESSYIVINGKNCKDKKVIIPSHYNGKPVTAIGEGAFYYCDSMEIVKIPATIQELGAGAFHRCYNLETVMFEQNSELLKIGDSAFLFCDSLQSINIPESVVDIGTKAFLHCFNLYTITLPDTLIHIGNDAFAYTGYYHKTDNWKNGTALYIGNHFVALNGKTTGSKYIVEDGTRVIADGVFAGCTNMRNIEMPTSVTSIGIGTFEGCSRLEYVWFKAGSELKKIHEKAFLNCESMIRVNYAGTLAEWNLVIKEENWIDPSKNFRVHCTDGDIQ